MFTLLDTTPTGKNYTHPEQTPKSAQEALVTTYSRLGLTPPSQRK
jgi:hypothetical protein